MTTEELVQRLLQRSERTNFDCKRTFYDIGGDKASETYKRAHGEMAKDILSLANGSPNTAGETAYLLIGAGNTLNQDGHRDLFNIEVKPNSKEILEKVNAFCDPPIDELICESVIIDGKQLLLITIPPSPHIHETTKNLQAKDSLFTRRTVFIRRNESNDVASFKDCETLSTIKRVRLRQRLHAPPVLFGLLVGASIGALILPWLIQNSQNLQRDPQNVGLAILIISISIGGLIGVSFVNIQKLVGVFQEVPPNRRILLFFLLFMIVGAFYVLTWLLPPLYLPILLGIGMIILILRGLIQEMHFS